MNASDFLAFAVANYPGKVEVGDARDAYVDSKREQTGSPATLTLACPDEVALALRNAPNKATCRYLMVKIPRSIERRAESRLVLPGEK